MTTHAVTSSSRGTAPRRPHGRRGGRFHWAPALVAVLGVMVTLVAAVNAYRTPGVYTAQANVVFLQPSSPAYGNVLRDGAETLVDFAALVDRRFDGNAPAPRPGTAAATLWGAGVRSGYSVRLWDSGTQWQTNFNRPVITVEVVDPDADGVRVRLVDLVTRITALADDIQSSAGVPRAVWIQTQTSPDQPVVSYAAGRAGRAALAFLALGAALTWAALTTVERRLRSRPPSSGAEQVTHPADATPAGPSRPGSPTNGPGRIVGEPPSPRS